jgi:hypothetical protein
MKKTTAKTKAPDKLCKTAKAPSPIPQKSLDEWMRQFAFDPRNSNLYRRDIDAAMVEALNNGTGQHLRDDCATISEVISQACEELSNALWEYDADIDILSPEELKEAIPFVDCSKPIGRDLREACIWLQWTHQATESGNLELAAARAFTLARTLERIRIQSVVPMAPTRTAPHNTLREATDRAFAIAAKDDAGREPTADAVLAALAAEGVRLLKDGKTLSWREPDGTRGKLSKGRWQNLLPEWRKNRSHMAQT